MIARKREMDYVNGLIKRATRADADRESAPGSENREKWLNKVRWGYRQRDE